jgi:non-specific serine/threonine protein kinase
MLETVREFGLERLVERGEMATIQAAHAAHYLALAEAAASSARGTGGGTYMRRLAVERANLRAALDWLDQTGQANATLRMTGALWHYWYRHGDLAEGRRRLERALSMAPPDIDAAARARALRGAGVLAWQSADYDHSRERLEAALAAYRTLDDRAGAAWVLNSLGCLFATRSEAEQAEAFLSEALATFRELGDAVGIAQLTANLGELAEGEGRHDLAIERLEEALTMWRDLDDRAGAARAQVFLGQALLARDEAARAEAALLEALTAIRDTGYEQILPAALRTVAQLAARRGAAAVAARWYGAEDGVRQALGMELPAARRAAHESAIAIVREALGEHAFTAAWDAGRGLSADQAVADVLAGMGAVKVLVASGVPSADHDTGLSPRERQVLTLLIDGRSDREIADALYISQRTASTHVSAILHKLEVGTRAEAAVRAVREGLV